MIDKEKLAQDNFGLIYGFLKHYNLNNINGEMRDEIIEALFVGFTKALSQYKEDRGSFSTIAFLCMQNAYFNWYKTYKRKQSYLKESIVSLDTWVDDDKETALVDLIPDERIHIEADIISKDLITKISDYAKRVLTKREYAVFELYFIKDLTLKEITENADVSKQRIHQVKNRIIDKMLKEAYMKYNVNEEFLRKLRPRDLLILNEITRSNERDHEIAKAMYYNSKRTDPKIIEQLSKEPVGVSNIAKLTEKYDYFGPQYDSDAHIFYFTKGMPVKVYSLFMEEAKKFKFNDIIIKGTTDKDLYIKWKETDRKYPWFHN